MFDFHNPFFRPLWRRIAIVAFCFGWAGVELWAGNDMWAMLFAAIGALAGYNFFVTKPFEKDSD